MIQIKDCIIREFLKGKILWKLLFKAKLSKNIFEVQWPASFTNYADSVTIIEVQKNNSKQVIYRDYNLIWVSTD